MKSPFSHGFPMVFSHEITISMAFPMAFPIVEKPVPVGPRSMAQPRSPGFSVLSPWKNRESTKNRIYGFIWFYMVLYGFYMVLYGFIWFYMVLYGFIWVLYGFIWFYMVLYGFIWFYMVLYGFYMVLYGFIWVLYGFYMVLYGFIWFYMVLYGFIYGLIWTIMG